jgi:peptidoglycan/xylan/chitin deacetylase (PgdA/CDA1 family)
MKTVVLLSALLIASGATATAQASVERPPQFVLLAFDNCTELERWKEWSDFAADMNRDRDRVHFTFFVSGVNFIADAHRGVYEGPRQRRGYASINFGGAPDDVRMRVDYINALHANGHEIASHAVGHFNGSGWSAAEWGQEFRAFNNVAKKIGPNNGLGDATKLAFPVSNIVGFRAPYLAKSAGLFTTLRDQGFRYDTSGVGSPTGWPQKVDGVWRFDLANLRISGTRKGTISMDYNFLVVQSGGFPSKEPARRAEFRDQMVQTYIDYFKANYAGNRAPLHIGHHFSDYQDGAYREALQIFARMVCGLPEVRCTTYSQLADFMDGQHPDALAAYRKGEFPRAAQPAIRLAETAR